jgi:hypothetical protein
MLDGLVRSCKSFRKNSNEESWTPYFPTVNPAVQEPKHHTRFRQFLHHIHCQYSYKICRRTVKESNIQQLDSF